MWGQMPTPQGQLSGEQRGAAPQPKADPERDKGQPMPNTARAKPTPEQGQSMPGPTATKPRGPQCKSPPPQCPHWTQTTAGPPTKFSLPPSPLHSAVFAWMNGLVYTCVIMATWSLRCSNYNQSIGMHCGSHPEVHPKSLEPRFNNLAWPPPPKKWEQQDIQGDPGQHPMEALVLMGALGELYSVWYWIVTGWESLYWV